MSFTLISPAKLNNSGSVERWIYFISRNWFLIFNLTYGIYVGLPFLAPVFMEFGFESGAKVIYFIYNFLCHQLPQRSLFLFGENPMYDLTVIQNSWQETINPLILRQFTGNAVMGWKMAWSDRMVSMYTSILIISWIYYPIRKHTKPILWWGLVIFLAPMGIDGITHTISDLAGIGQGFRDTNNWLVNLTNSSFLPSFYAGDNLGSFNSIIRWISGILFGWGVVWFSLPLLDEIFKNKTDLIRSKFER